MFWKKKSELNAEVLLKRQVPILSKDEARSWLGGNPRAPAGMQWPRNSKGVPLQFLAQVACEDFPEALWYGLGPRSGWLLLFANVSAQDQTSLKEEVQVVLVDTIGPEIEPPEDCPVSRHAMKLGPLRSVNFEHPGVPKYWRKWPVDFIVHEYEDFGDPMKKPYPLYRAAEEIYGARVSELWLSSKSFGLEQPLTWRGALYVVESILHELGTTEKLKRDFVGMKSGLLDHPPEPDPSGFNSEFERRRQANPNLADGDWSHMGGARAALESEIKAERRTGWLVRARLALVREMEEQKQSYVSERQNLDALQNTMDDEEISRAQIQLDKRAKSLKELEQDLLYLDGLIKSYPGPEGENNLNAEFKELGEAYLERGTRMVQKLGDVRAGMLNRDLDSPLPRKDWEDIKRIWEDVAGFTWKKNYRNLPVKTERKFDASWFIGPAILEDLLDLYTGDNSANVQLEPAWVDDIEASVRYLGRIARHQLGGQLIPIQSDMRHDPSRVLLFQISSDRSLGWSWGDQGNLYVTISREDLKSKRFQNVEAWLEFH